MATALRHVEKIIKPKMPRDITGPAIATWQTKLRALSLAGTTIGFHSRHLKATLRWAKDMELIETVPKVKMPKKAQRSKMKGLAITVEEHERMHSQDRFDCRHGSCT